MNIRHPIGAVASMQVLPALLAPTIAYLNVGMEDRDAFEREVDRIGELFNDATNSVHGNRHLDTPVTDDDFRRMLARWAELIQAELLETADT